MKKPQFKFIKKVRRITYSYEVFIGVLLLTGIVLVVSGFFSLSSNKKNFTKVDAVVSEVIPYISVEEEYGIKLEYTIDGVDYYSVLSINDYGSYQQNQTVTILVLNDDYSIIKLYSVSGIVVCFVLGSIFIALGTAVAVYYYKLKTFEQSSKNNENQESIINAVVGVVIEDEEHSFFVIPDNNMKLGYYLVDKDNNELYHAETIKCGLDGSNDILIINHQTGQSTKHSVGKVIVPPANSTNKRKDFTIDGKSIYEHLRSSDITIKKVSDANQERVSYEVKYKGEIKAVISSSNKDKNIIEPNEEVNEKNEEVKIEKGYFCIQTILAPTDLLMIIAYIIARLEE